MFDALAENGSAAVVYLDGYRGNWNDARRQSAFPARTEKIDDVGFVRAVIKKFNPARVYAVGYSNGGQLVMRLVHEIPELLSGATVIAATMPAPDNFAVAHDAGQPLPVLLIHGTKDPIISYAGGEMSWWARALFKVGGRARSMPATAAYFAARNGITADPAVARTGEIERTDYRQDGHPPVTLITVHGGGHTVPGPPSSAGPAGR
jgi:polyhydroxybutyrate depolymerase